MGVTVKFRPIIYVIENDLGFRHRTAYWNRAKWFEWGCVNGRLSESYGPEMEITLSIPMHKETILKELFEHLREAD